VFKGSVKRCSWCNSKRIVFAEETETEYVFYCNECDEDFYVLKKIKKNGKLVNKE